MYRCEGVTQWGNFLPVVIGNSCISHAYLQPQVLAPKGAAGARGSEADAMEQVTCSYHELSMGTEFSYIPGAMSFPMVFIQTDFQCSNVFR